MIVVGAAIACGLAAWFLAPAAIERALTAAVANHTGGRLAVGQLRVMPATLTVTADDVSVIGPNGAPLVSAARIDAGLHPVSLVRRGWLFREVTAERLALTPSIVAENIETVPAGIASRLRELVTLLDRAGLGTRRLRVVDGRIELGLGRVPANRGLTFTELDLLVEEPAADASRAFRIEGSMRNGSPFSGDGSISVSPVAVALSATVAAPNIDWLTSHLTQPLLRNSRSGAVAGDIALDHREDFTGLSGNLDIAYVVFGPPDRAIRFSDLELSLPPADDNANRQLTVDSTLGSGTAEATARWNAAESAVLPRFTLTLENVELAALSPHPERLLGLHQVAGELTLLANARANAGVLTIDNRVVIENLTIDGPAARDGVLPLAVALHQDARGRIDITLPVPPLSLTRDLAPADIIAAALGEFFASMSSSPFAALRETSEAALERPAGESLGRLEFAAGSADILPATEAKLESLGAALASRPKLGLRVPALFAPAADRHALARSAVRLHVNLATSAGPPGASPTPLDVDDPKVRGVLDEFAGSRLSASRLARLTERFPDNDSARYRAIFEALVANESVTDTVLRRLARYRAQSVRDRLASLGIADARLELSEDVGTTDAVGDFVPVELQPWAQSQTTAANDGSAGEAPIQVLER